MNVGLDRRGEIEVDDVGDVLEVNTSGDAVLFILRPLKHIYHVTVDMSPRIEIICVCSLVLLRLKLKNVMV